MGSHTWTEQCPYCGFKEIIASSYNSLYFEAACPICGYSKWTEEKVPDKQTVEQAKHELSRMSSEEQQEALEFYLENNIPLIVRLKG